MFIKSKKIFYFIIMKNISVLIGFIAVVMFAGTFPATKLALEVYSPLHATCLRASSATLFALLFFICVKFINRQIVINAENHFFSSTSLNEIRELFIIGLLLVFGFPGAVAFALAEVSSAYSAVILAMLPLCLSAAAVLIAKERPPLLFWACSLIAATLVGIFMVNAYYLKEDVSIETNQNFILGNFWLLLACLCAAIGYTKSASLNKKFSGFYIISWGLCLTSPISFILSYFLWPKNLSIYDALYHSSSLWGVLYLGLLSMFIGNCLWSIALSKGGIAKIGQLQFLQPFITIFISFWLLSEIITKEMILFASTVTLVVIIGQRQRFSGKLT